MDEDTLNDLKQFIAATVSQATADMATKEGIARLEKKVDDLDLKVDTIAEMLHGNLDDHETRLTKLEQQSA